MYGRKFFYLRHIFLILLGFSLEFESGDSLGVSLEESLSSLKKIRAANDTANFRLSVIHLNDFHARFEETSQTSTPCRNPANGTCYGGIARIKTAIDSLQAEAENSIFLNAGDNYQGTIYYTQYGWNITAEFMNMLPHDALTLGNHEFDRGVEGCIPFMTHFNSPIVVSNIDDTLVPEFQGKYTKSIVIEKGGRKIGIIGYILKTTNKISQTGELRFFDEITSVRAEAQKLKASGVDILIGLSHSGLDVDKQVAAQVEELDLVVGGHSHTFLYTGVSPDIDDPWDVYPVVVKQASGRQVPVVQAYAYSKYLGHLNIEFNAQGEAVSWEGNPILLDSTVQQDAQVAAALVPWTEGIKELGDQKVGSTKVFLDKENNICRKGECNIGNFITDAMVHEGINFSNSGGWTKAAIAVINTGGIRASIDETNFNITFEDLITAQPFGNTFDYIELQGKHIKETLEFSFSKSYQNFDYKKSSFIASGGLQWSGIQTLIDIREPAMSRVNELKIRCSECRVPIFEEVDPEKWYSLIVVSFLVDGGDAYSVIRDNYRNRVIGRLDTEVLIDYLKQMSPLTTPFDGRIKVIQVDGTIH